MNLPFTRKNNGQYVLSKRRGDFEVIAGTALREHQPSALRSPSALDLDELAVGEYTAPDNTDKVVLK
jgi:hypothetical protein